MHVNRGLLLGLMASVAAVTVASTPAVTQQTQKPNVVFILADNVGYGDMGPYGGGELRGAPTPRIDQPRPRGPASHAVSRRARLHDRRARR